MSINKVVISGNLTRDPELRQTANGFPVLGFGVAFGARAESVSRFLSKGSKVAIEGKLRWSQWERDGQKRSKIEVVVDEIEFMTARGEGGNMGMSHMSAPAPAYAAPTYAPAPAAPAVDTSVYDEDIPF